MFSSSSSLGKYSDLGSLIERTKTEIHKKLKDLKTAEIKVQLEVEYKNKLAFRVTKTSDGEPIDFQPLEQPNDRHVIYFNYDSIVDFSIGVKNLTPSQMVDFLEEKLLAIERYQEEQLNAEIESMDKMETKNEDKIKY